MPVNICTANRAAIRDAARLLADGKLVAFPTETVYGLGADARNAVAVGRIFEAKRRPADHPRDRPRGRHRRRRALGVVDSTAGARAGRTPSGRGR